MHAQQAKTRPLAASARGAATKKRRGGFHIRPCPLAVKQTSAGAYRMRPYGLRFRQREKTPRGAPPSLGPLCGGGLRPQAVGERTVRRAGIFRAQTGENSCRGEHCSPVPACLTRQLSRKMRCGGKLAGDQWSPLHTQQGKTRVLSARHKKRRGGFHIRPCPLATSALPVLGDTTKKESVTS